MKIKLEVGKKYTFEGWRSNRWVKILYIGETTLALVTEEGEVFSLERDTDLIPYEEKKELAGFEPFFVLFSENHLEVVYDKNKEEVVKRVKIVEGSYINVFTKEEAKKAGLKF